MHMHQYNISAIFSKRLLALLCFVFAATGASAQSGSVTFSPQRMTIKAAMGEITKQSGYLFAVNHTALDDSKVVQFPTQSLTVAQALDKLLESTGCTYEVSGKHILIVARPETPKQTTPVARPVRSESVIPPVPPARSNQAKTEVSPKREEAKPTQQDTKPVQQDPQQEVRIVVTEPVQTPAVTYPDMADMRDIPPLTSSISKREARKRSVRYGTNAPVLSLKVNLLYGGATLTPNLGIEVGLGRKTSLDLFGSYNPWNLNGDKNDNRKLVHWVARPEFRYWFSERSGRHFMGLHGFYGQYNIAKYDVPSVFEKDFRYEGNVYGGGISYGYHWVIGRHWGIEFNVGGGVAFLKYDKFNYQFGGDKVGTFKKTYIGPTNAGIKIVYIIK